jgi:hypothetical protein
MSYAIAKRGNFRMKIGKRVRAGRGFTGCSRLRAENKHNDLLLVGNHDGAWMKKVELRQYFEKKAGKDDDIFSNERLGEHAGYGRFGAGGGRGKGYPLYPSGFKSRRDSKALFE